MHESSTKTGKKQPSVWSITTDIPDLFSFSLEDSCPPLLLHWMISFKSYIDLFNKVARLETLVLDPYQLHQIQIWLSGGEEVMIKIDSSEAKKMCARFMFANFLLMPMLGKHPEVIPKLKKLIGLLRNLNEKDDEMQWYHICALRYLSLRFGKYSINLINETVSCLRTMTSVRHRGATLYFVLEEYAKKLDAYVDYQPFLELERLFPDKPWRYDGFCALLRHNYLLRHCVENTEYFDIQNSPLHKQTLSNENKVELVIKQNQSCLGQQVSVVTHINIRLLFTFAAHLVPPSVPILYLNIPGVDDFKLNQFNIALKRELRANGFCNSEGFLTDSALPDGSGSNAKFEKFREIIMNLVEKMIQPFPTRALRLQYEYQNLKLEELRKQYGNLVLLAEQLSGMNGIDALHLFYRCLQPHQYAIELSLLEEIKEAVLRCIEIARRAKEINDSDISDNKKSDAWYALAGEIVQWLVMSKKLLLIQIGTPIKNCEKFSDHAIYVAAKYLAPTDEIHIIITNGGDKVSLFHSLSELCHPKEREEYHYAAFKPFKIDKEHLTALKHYLYRCISIEFTKSVSDDEVDTNEAGEIIGQNQNTFSALLKNVYLRTTKPGQNEFFIGYCFKKITIFQRQDLTETFLVQFTGNCTIHNLLKALQKLYNMDQIVFGQLGDTLVLGCDKLISQYKPELQVESLAKVTPPQIKKSGILSLDIDSYPNVGFWESAPREPRIEKSHYEPPQNNEKKKGSVP